MTTAIASTTLDALLDAAARNGWRTGRVGHYGYDFTRGEFVVRVRLTRTGAIREWEHDVADPAAAVIAHGDAHSTGKRAAVLAVLAAPVPDGETAAYARDLRPGDLIRVSHDSGVIVGRVERDPEIADRTAVYPLDGHGGIAEAPYMRYLDHQVIRLHKRGLPAPAPLTVPMPAAQPGECPDCLAPEGECNAATCPAYASDDAPLPAALLPDAPLGTIRFYEGCEDAPQCPCGNDVQGDGFRYVTVATSVDGPVGVFIEADGAWHALGRHVACVADHCLRVWSDRDIVRDGTGAWAPVTMRLHHVAEAVTG